MSDVLLAQKWSDENPTGWWLSEKLDGVRALWKDGQFLSRGDNSFKCPDWFRSQMPAGCVLDGEIWGGRQQFNKTVGIVKSSSRGAEWEFLTYMVFDVLKEKGTALEHRPFEERLEVVNRICRGGGSSKVLKAVPMQLCKGREHLQEVLEQVENRGGEGLMLRQPRSVYEHRRSKTLLKVKTFHDEEAIVVGHEEGKAGGRTAGLCGALVCKTPDGRQFKVGSGLSDEQRRAPPKVGAVITYRYQELTQANIPRFPTLVAERVDLPWHSICATYTAPGPKRDAALKKKHSVIFDETASSSAAASPATVAAASGAGVAGQASASASAGTAASAAPSAAGSNSPGAGRGTPLLAEAWKTRRPLSCLDVLQLGAAEEDLEDLGAGDGPDAAAPGRGATASGGAAAAAASGEAPPAKRAKTGGDERPVCKYGAKCYRVNPAHFADFRHPWLDEENLDVVAGGAVSSAATIPAVAPVGHPACPKSASAITVSSVLSSRRSAVPGATENAFPAAPLDTLARADTVAAFIPADTPAFGGGGQRKDATAAITADAVGGARLASMLLCHSSTMQDPSRGGGGGGGGVTKTSATKAGVTKAGATKAGTSTSAGSGAAPAISVAAADRPDAPIADPAPSAASTAVTADEVTEETRPALELLLKASSAVRMTAAKQLLESLRRDSLTDNGRGNFGVVLNLLGASPPSTRAAEAAPTASSAAAALTPPPPTETLPAATLAAAASRADTFRPRAEAARAKQDDAGETLRNMGFAPDAVEAALKECSALEAALEWLLARRD
eukprot:TRINITY_DN30439_c0_g1_i1.p1 TRINITY_DN30439_c0_g1~~TRINITY_DN30439_c0_g1_i1.p1  ORF type:complete len:786 (+),score=177.72 TRINITY_DN30439_c0_g1_i1:96-2453(+)